MRSTFRISLIAGLLLPVLTALIMCAVSAQNNEKTKLFQIGEFNRSSGEFSSGSPQQKVNFVVSKSDPARDWFGKQPCCAQFSRQAAGGQH